MNKRKKKYSKYTQGRFNPVHKEKYKGTFPVIYRSSWELAAFKWLDRHPKCTKWGSESAVVRYISPIDKKEHRYFIDLTATFQTDEGLQTYYIEIKPEKQTQPPKPSKRKKQLTFLREVAEYKKNQAKWDAAKKFAKKKGAVFLVLTEKHLFKK
jgi:hypothetical protein